MVFDTLGVVILSVEAAADVLKVGLPVSQTVLRQAFLCEVRVHHPDLHMAEPAHVQKAHHTAFLLAEAAFRVLSEVAVSEAALAAVSDGGTLSVQESWFSDPTDPVAVVSDDVVSTVVKGTVETAPKCSSIFVDVVPADVVPAGSVCDGVFAGFFDRDFSREAAFLLLSVCVDKAARELFSVVVSDFAKRVVELALEQSKYCLVTSLVDGRSSVGLMLSVSDAFRSAARSWPVFGREAGLHACAFELVELAEECLWGLYDGVRPVLPPFPFSAVRV